MKLQTKFSLAITIVFATVAAVITAATVYRIDADTIREAEHRVRTYTRAAWEILNGKVVGIRSASEILAQRIVVKNLLQDLDNEQLSTEVRTDLEAIRRAEKMDILNLLAPDGTVVLRTRVPYCAGDNLASDPMVRQAITTRKPIAGITVLESARLSLEGPDLVERCLAMGTEPRGMLAGAAVPVIEAGKLIGIVQMGSLLNGDEEVVDRIRDAVFNNEYYRGKPVGTATIFLGDTRISTNVQDSQGLRAVGTHVSREVAEHVAVEGSSWTGRAFVVDTWYLSQYDPITDPDGGLIGMLYVGELEQKFVDMRTRAILIYLSIVLVGMVVALMIFLYVARSMLGAIQGLSEATMRVSEGDLGHRVAIRSRDEVGRLAASFNRMAEQLEGQQREITHRQQDLEALNDELRTMNRNYMEMLGFVSHELKNPLTSAMMGLYTVKDGYLGDVNPSQARSLESVAHSLSYFKDMIRNYLDLSRLEKGELEVNKVQIRLHDHVVLPALEALERELEEQQLTVDDRIPEGLVLKADPNLLRIVYDNLLSNAVKYGRAGGSIVLGAEGNSDAVTLSVRNEGDGIPADKMTMLFKKFSRLDGPECAGKRGTGLGLFICREIVEKQGGRIWAESDEGNWAKFSFTIPN